jgi:ArsR family transcriptional regulator, arsenate/arsenite/antimonite-responsive transcriptional repressor
MQTKAEEFDAELGEMANLARALSHPARLSILKYLSEQNTCICGEIVEELPLAQATVSRHLKVLKEAGLISVTQRGLTSCYCLRPEAIGRLRRQFDDFFSGIDADCSASC